MKATVTVLGGRATIEITADDVRGLVKELSFFTQLPERCGDKQCDAEVHFTFRNVADAKGDKHDYYGMECSRGHSATFGIYKGERGLFYKSGEPWKIWRHHETEEDDATNYPPPMQPPTSNNAGARPASPAPNPPAPQASATPPSRPAAPPTRQGATAGATASKVTSQEASDFLKRMLGGGVPAKSVLALVPTIKPGATILTELTRSELERLEQACGKPRPQRPSAGFEEPIGEDDGRDDLPF